MYIGENSCESNFPVDFKAMEDFAYVIRKFPPARICFGSGAPRKVVVTHDKPSNNLGPAYYDGVYHYEKIRSKRGIPGLANTAERVTLDTSQMIIPDPCKYSIVKPIDFVQNCVPFNVGNKRLKRFINNNPGPSTYKPSRIQCKRTRVDYNFGRPCVVPAVEMICINYPNKKCEKCGEPFEYGDFWHRNYQDYLCTQCMEEEHHLHEMYQEKELCSFKKIRTCTFIHRHEGTSAAIRLMPKNKIAKRFRIENYLSLYSKCYCTKSYTELTIPLNDRL